MSGLVWLLLLGAFFYLMMRFGCGAHAVHGGHGSPGGEGHEGHAGHGGGHANPEGSAKDPVCGMEVEPGKGYSKIHEGLEYRFCSRKCLDKFDKEPQHYLS